MKLLIRLIILVLSLALCSGVWAGDQIGYWNFNASNSNDSSGYNNNGTDTAITYTTGAPNRGIGASFNGTSSFISLANQLVINNDYTCCVWANSNASGVVQTIIVNSAVGDNRGWMFNIQPSNQLRFYGSDDGTSARGKATATTNFLLDLNSWIHICFVFVSSTTDVTFYKNAISLNDDGTVLYASFYNPSSSRIGAYAATGIFFSGIMDDIKIYNYALTATQILHEYQQSHLVTELKYEPWKFTDLFKLAFYLGGNKLNEKDQRISYLRQYPVN